MNKETWQESIIPSMKFRRSSTDLPDADQSTAIPPGFEELFKEHWPRIYRLAWRIIGDSAEAEDLALEAFYRLSRQFSRLDSDFNGGGWLYRVPTNLALQSIRSFKRREFYERSAGTGALEKASDNQPAEIFNEREDHRLARRVLSEMKSQQAELLILRYSGLAYKEIGAALGLSPTSIGPLLLRAEREFERRYRALMEEK